MEKSDLLRVIPVSMGWSDVGSWQAVWELADKDEDGNAANGPATFLEAKNNFVLSDDLVCLVGVENLGVIATDDAILVFDRRRGDLVRSLVAELKAKGRKEVDEHLKVFRPWGSYQSIDIGSRFQVKRIVVKPGGRLSLQKHFHRAEHWVVVRGTALVTVGDQQIRAARERVDLYPPRRGPSARKSREDTPRTYRGSERQLSRRRRHRPARRHLQPELNETGFHGPAWVARFSMKASSSRRRGPCAPPIGLMKRRRGRKVKDRISSTPHRA